MDWYENVFELIDMRSFSNLWYWIMLAVVWSVASHWVLGVPYDMVIRARREGGQADADLRDMVRINVARLLWIVRLSGLWLMGLVFCMLTSLALLGFLYDVEFAQAVLLIAAPMTLVGVLSMRAAQRVADGPGEGAVLHRQLLRHRLLTQFIGMVSIFVTAMWGMWQNMQIGVFGN